MSITINFDVYLLIYNNLNTTDNLIITSEGDDFPISNYISVLSQIIFSVTLENII